MTKTSRRVPFPEHSANQSFSRSYNDLLRDLLRRVVDKHVPPENMHTFYHGTGWTHKRSDGKTVTGDVKPHTAETQLPFSRIVEGDLSAVAEQARSVLVQMEAAFMKNLYETVGAAVEEVGNVVDAKGKPPAEAFIEMLTKIEFGVDRAGKVTRPEIRMHPDASPGFMKALTHAGPEFEAKVGQLISQKEADALAREKERKERFKTRPTT